MLRQVLSVVLLICFLFPLRVFVVHHVLCVVLYFCVASLIALRHDCCAASSVLFGVTCILGCVTFKLYRAFCVVSRVLYCVTLPGCVIFLCCVTCVLCSVKWIVLLDEFCVASLVWHYLRLLCRAPRGSELRYNRGVSLLLSVTCFFFGISPYLRQ